MRECFRLMAIIRAKGSAESLETCEILRLADWIAAPPREERASQWAAEIAVPLIKELGRRLENQLRSQDVALPEFFGLVHNMRIKQRAFHKVRRAKAADRNPKFAEQLAAEKPVDRMLSEYYQPKLEFID